MRDARLHPHSGTAPGPEARRAPAASRLEQQVLCVDDDVDFLKSLEFFLPRQINVGTDAPCWYRFHFIDNPHQALGLMEELASQNEVIAMVMSDQKMPEMKGIEFLAKARTISEDSVRVLLTGYAGIESAITAINEHLLDRYLTKPIDNEHDFTLSVSHLLQRFEMQKHIREQNLVIANLYEFSNALNALADMRGTTDYLASFTRSALRCGTVSVLLHEDGALNPVACTDSPPGAGYLRVPLAEPPALRIGCELVAHRLEDLPNVRIVPAADQDTSGPPKLFASLTSGEAFLGVLVAAGARQGGDFDELERQTLNHIATTASIAMHNQLNHDRLRAAFAETLVQARSLERLNERLEILDRLKSDFLTFISHEVRTPLAGMSTVMMLDEVENPADRARLIHATRDSYERLQGFVLRGLEYFDWLGGGQVKRGSRSDVGVAVEQVTAPLCGAKDRPVDVEVARTDSACSVPMEQAYVESVIGALVDNALKFSGERPWVRIELSAMPALVRLVVIDRGQGFSPEMAGELFRPFTIADTLHHHRGTGLSLAIANAMMQAHGGSLRAESLGSGRGAKFVVEWPTADAPPPGSGGSPEE
jgi:signal transduction histidine kinase/ActR/RegA family two-component response regulator